MTKPIPLGPVEIELLEHVTDQWRPFREILFEFNGPRQTTVAQNSIQKSLTSLQRKKIVESKKVKTRSQSQDGDERLYRLRNAA